MPVRVVRIPTAIVNHPIIIPVPRYLLVMVVIMSALLSDLTGSRFILTRVVRIPLLAKSTKVYICKGRKNTVALLRVPRCIHVRIVRIPPTIVLVNRPRYIFVSVVIMPLLSNWSKVNI